MDREPQETSTSQTPAKNETGRQNERQSKHFCEFLGFRSNAVEISILLGCDTVSHPGRMETSALRYITIMEDEKGKEAAAKSLVIVLVSLPSISVGLHRSVGIVTHYGLVSPGIKSWRGRDFLQPSRLALGPT